MRAVQEPQQAIHRSARRWTARRRGGTTRRRRDQAAVRRRTAQRCTLATVHERNSSTARRRTAQRRDRAPPRPRNRATTRRCDGSRSSGYRDPPQAAISLCFERLSRPNAQRVRTFNARTRMVSPMRRARCTAASSRRDAWQQIAAYLPKSPAAFAFTRLVWPG